MKKRVYEYVDPLNDDFAGTKIEHRPLPKKFRFVHKDPFSVVLSFLLYRLIALPVLWIVGKLKFGIAVKGKKNLRSLRGKPAFFYGNHTQIADAWLVQCYLTGKRTYIVADQDATSIPGLRYLLKLLGCIPVPEDAEQRKCFVEALEHHVKMRRGIVIYPEAHIWPYCTKIRPFGDAAFTYPAEMDVATVPFCVTYRKRRFRKNKSPLMTVHVGKPIYPNMRKSLPERKKELRDRVYDYMIDRACEDENVEWVSYVRKKEEKKD